MDLFELKRGEKLSKVFVYHFPLLKQIYLFFQISSQLEKLCTCLHHPSTAVRHMSSRVLAALSLRDTPRVMHFVIDNVLPFLDAMDSLNRREGGTEAVASILYIRKAFSPPLCLYSVDYFILRLVT